MIHPPNRRDLLALAPALALAGRAVAAMPKEAPMARSCPIVELRQYTMHAGRRDVFIALFEREFVATQEAAGIRVLGLFRDLDDPNRVVWLRGFPDMPSRAASLTAFYGGPAWKAHRDAANACILDSDNVLLLHPLGPEGGFDAALLAPPPRLVVAEVRYLDPAAGPAFADFFASHMRPRMQAAGGHVLGVFETEQSANNFRLPVRENLAVLVAVLGFASDAGHRAYAAAIAEGPDWREAAPEALLGQFARKPEMLRLAPTAGFRVLG